MAGAKDGSPAVLPLPDNPMTNAELTQVYLPNALFDTHDPEFGYYRHLGDEARGAGGPRASRQPRADWDQPGPVRLRQPPRRLPGPRHARASAALVQERLDYRPKDRTSFDRRSACRKPGVHGTVIAPSHTQIVDQPRRD